MNCNKCNQDSIKIDNGHIICDVCGLDIDVSWNLDDELPDLFIFNLELELAEDMGSTAYREDKSKDENPYSLSSNELALNKRWEKGWNSEEIIDEKEALLFSSQKLKSEIDKILLDNKNIVTNSEEKEDNYNKLLKYIKELKDKKYKLGRRYRQDIEQFLEIPDK